MLICYYDFRSFILVVNCKPFVNRVQSKFIVTYIILDITSTYINCHNCNPMHANYLN